MHACVHTHTQMCKHVFSCSHPEAASIFVTQHAEVTLGATCSLLQVLLAKVHMHQFISAHQFVRATHFCLLAEYFKSESLLTLVCVCTPACFTCMCKPVTEYAYFILCERKTITSVCLRGCTLHPGACVPFVHLYFCSALPGHFQRPHHLSQTADDECVRTCRLPNLLLQSYGWGTAEDILYQTD